MRALSILLTVLFASPALAAPAVITDQGALTGVGDNGVVSYKGIPYVSPPVAALRWQPPQPGPRWQGTRDASAFGPACPQHATDGPIVRANLPQSEDCLTLNVWTPEDRHGRLPVMVWIHGGGFTQGTASVNRYDGAELARHGVVLVSFNYRLGRLGFFAWPGFDQVNFGLLDQIAALQWVKCNIAAFGGDPANVTVFGESAGGAAVEALMTSPLAKGLFAKAISESGGLFKTDGLDEARANAQSFAARLDASGPDALATLRAAPAAQIVSDDESGPILDGKVLTEDVADAFAAGHIETIPYLAGSNSDEGSQIGDGPNDWLTQPFGDRLPSVRALYEKDGKLSEVDFRHQIFNDRFFAGPAAITAAAVARAGMPAYVYRFEFLTDLARRRGQTGVVHGGEKVFVFGFGPMAAFAPPQDSAMSATMQSYWTNFARTGDPNGAGLPPWPKFEGRSPPTLVIDDKPHAVRDFRQAQFEAVNPARRPAP